MTNDIRVQPGVPSGGEFANHNRAEGDALTVDAASLPHEPIDFDAVTAQLEQISNEIAALHVKQFQLGKAGLTAVIKERMPDAAVISIEDQAEEGSPWLMVSEVRDEDGGILWDGDIDAPGDTEENDALYDLAQTFSPYLDGDMDSLIQAGTRRNPIYEIAI